MGPTHQHLESMNSITLCWAATDKNMCFTNFENYDCFDLNEKNINKEIEYTIEHKNKVYTLFLTINTNGNPLETNSITLVQKLNKDNKTEKITQKYLECNDIIEKRTNDVNQLKADRSIKQEHLDTHYDVDEKEKIQLYRDMQTLTDLINNHNRVIESIKNEQKIKIEYIEQSYVRSMDLQTCNLYRMDLCAKNNDESNEIYFSDDKFYFFWYIRYNKDTDTDTNIPCPFVTNINKRKCDEYFDFDKKKSKSNGENN